MGRSWFIQRFWAVQATISQQALRSMVKAGFWSRVVQILLTFQLTTPYSPGSAP